MTTNNTTTTNDTINLTTITGFVHQVNNLPRDLKRAFELVLTNPTDAAMVVFDTFLEHDSMEDLSELLDTAVDLRITNAQTVSDMLTAWMHDGDDDDDN